VLRPGGAPRTGLVAEAPAKPAPPRAGQGARSARAASPSRRCPAASDLSRGCHR